MYPVIANNSSNEASTKDSQQRPKTKKSEWTKSQMWLASNSTNQASLIDHSSNMVNKERGKAESVQQEVNNQDSG